MAWQLALAALFALIRTGYGWWIAQVDTTGRHSKVFGGLTQGDPLSPNILNVVVDAVVCHWILLVAGCVGGKDGWGREGQH